MNRELVQKWITALRSGEYQQHKFQLRYEETNKFCVLGVGSDIAGMNWNDYHNGELDSVDFEIPPTFILKDLGIEKIDKDLNDKTALGFGDGRVIGSLLAYLNDCQDWDFNRLADFIEQHLLPE